MINKLTLVFLLVFIQSCAFVTEETEIVLESEQCRVQQKNLDLKVQSLENTALATCVGQGCAIAMLVVPVGSFVASGSVVLANNVINWVEYQGKCNIPELFAGKQDPDRIEETCLLQCNKETGMCKCIN